MPKDKRAFIFYIITSLVLWQFGISIRDLCIRPDMQIITKDNPFVSFVYLKNTGGAFSLFNDYTNLLAAFGIIALLAIIIYSYKKLEFDDKYKILTITSLTAGILGNLAERLAEGYVIDFIKLNFVNFAVFNFFDILISVSICSLAILIFYDEFKKRIFEKHNEDATDTAVEQAELLK